MLPSVCAHTRRSSTQDFVSIRNAKRRLSEGSKWSARPQRNKTWGLLNYSAGIYLFEPRSLNYTNHGGRAFSTRLLPVLCWVPVVPNLQSVVPESESEGRIVMCGMGAQPSLPVFPQFGTRSMQEVSGSRKEVSGSRSSYFYMAKTRAYVSIHTNSRHLISNTGTHSPLPRILVPLRADILLESSSNVQPTEVFLAMTGEHFLPVASEASS